ncbi:MAG: type VII secretion protein EccB [Propionibacteriaceae bacterium]|nr:type VII secretion protein EccB [Propionibacteriaceae bacterium]
MPSNKEILEAQKYNRRRLVTAFASGMPDGRELESKSPFTPFLVGFIIVAVMLGVGAVMSRFTPTLPQDWQQSTLIVVKGTGARYYTINGVLRPVSNITSAKLLSDSGNYKTSEVAASTIEGIDRGSPVGITNIPDDVPSPDRLHSDLWFSCVIPEKTHTWVAQSPTDKTTRGGVLVRHQKDIFLVADGLRHRIPEEHANKVLLALGLESITPIQVNATWLALFEIGSDLKPLEIENAGSPVSGLPEHLNTAVIGTVIEVKEGSSTRSYVVTDNNTLTPMSATAEKLYALGDSKAQGGPSLTTSVSDLTNVIEVSPTSLGPSDLPSQIENMVPKGSLPCAQLDRQPDGSVVPKLYSMTHEALADALPAGRGTATTAEQKLQGVTAQVSVLGGSGALIQTTSGGSLGSVMLVSDLGAIHGLGHDPNDSLARLGYSESDLLVVPASWAALVPEGPSLDFESVWATVGEE